MDFDPPAAVDSRRLALRRWLADHRDASSEVLAGAGLVAPQLSPPWGLGADAEHQLIVHEELARAGAVMPDNPIGIGWAAPTIASAGTSEQQQRWLPDCLAGRTFWCQLFSEPEAGSDLANVQTRAVLDGDEWVISGSKIWSSYADRADLGILLARTDTTTPKHKGISYFVLPMDQPGIEVAPIVDMTGGHHFNEVFLDAVRIPRDHLIGAPGDGWRLATATLANERVSLSSGGVLWGMGPTSDEIFEIIRGQGGVQDGRLRQRLARAYSSAFVLELLGKRIVSETIQGGAPGPAVSVKKCLADLHGQDLMETLSLIAGANVLVQGWSPLGTPAEETWGTWSWAYLFSRALTIGGGTTEVQKGIIAERLLGLPRS